LPIHQTATPASQEELAREVQSAYESGTFIYPIGGGTSLDYGLPAKTPGMGLELAALNRVIDFPARDLTVTVEAGITMQQLAQTLAAEGLRLAVDVPQAQQATLGGVIATAWSGPRRFGYGSIRDFVIGITAIDGRGETFHGGGRVVKNVAGYDFCKLLTGSLGTLGVITQVTLKLRPLAETAEVCVVPLSDVASIDPLLDWLTKTDVTPAAVEVVSGPKWNEQTAYARALAAILLEGTSPEVNWLGATTADELRPLAPGSIHRIPASDVAPYWRSLVEFPATDAPLALKATVQPSGVPRFWQGVLAIDPEASVQAHAGSGIVYVQFSAFPASGLSRTLVGKLQPLAAQCGGHVVVLKNPGGQEMTHQSVWGSLGAQLSVMQQVKQQFDPRGLLNPGRFVV
jgi:glycolate oxidase FAD binding subunit